MSRRRQEGVTRHCWPEAHTPERHKERSKKAPQEAASARQGLGRDNGPAAAFLSKQKLPVHVQKRV